MKKIILNLVISFSLTSLAFASERDESFTQPSISKTQKLESQLHH